MTELGVALILAPFVLLFGVRVWLTAQDVGWKNALLILLSVLLLLGSPVLGAYLVLNGV